MADSAHLSPRALLAALLAASSLGVAACGRAAVVGPDQDPADVLYMAACILDPCRANCCW